MLDCMKRPGLLKAAYSVFIQERIWCNFPLARFSCSNCESPALCSASANSRHYLQNEICSKHLAALLNCSHRAAVSVIADFPRIIKQNPFLIKETLSILLQHVDMEEILKNPSVFCIKTEKIGERINMLQEIGTIQITVDKVIRFSMLMKQPLEALMKKKVISSMDEIIDNILLAFGCPEETTPSLKEKVTTRNTRTRAREFRAHVMQTYLCWKLNCSTDTIRKIFRIYPSICSHSCQTIKQTLDILINKFHFPDEKICSNGFVLELYPNNLENILTSVPTLAGKDIRSCAVRTPRILCMSPKYLLETERIAKENNYSDEQLMNRSSIYTLKPTTVQQRLKTIENEQELAIRKYIPYVLFTVHSYKLVLHNLNYLKENEVVPTALYKLAYKNFKEMERTHSFVDIFLYLANVFNKTKSEVRGKVKEYPCINFDSLSNAKQVTEYLLNNGVSKEQLWHGIYIVFYSIESVKEQFIKLASYEELHPFDEWKSHPNFIHLLLYYLEKDSDGPLGNYTGKYEAIVQNHLDLV